MPHAHGQIARGLKRIFSFGLRHFYHVERLLPLPNLHGAIALDGAIRGVRYSHFLAAGRAKC